MSSDLGYVQSKILAYMSRKALEFGDSFKKDYVTAPELTAELQVTDSQIIDRALAGLAEQGLIAQDGFMVPMLYRQRNAPYLRKNRFHKLRELKRSKAYYLKAIPNTESSITTVTL